MIGLRKRLGLSQRDAAAKVGMATSNFAWLEAGRHVPSMGTIVRVAQALRRPLSELVAKPPST